jgi:Ca2+-binding RTX toxin-like protein
MTLLVTVRDAEGMTIFSGNATFDASENSGIREFEWTNPVQSGPIINGAAYNVSFEAETGMNAVVHNAVLFGTDLGMVHPKNNEPIVDKTFVYSGETLGSDSADNINGGEGDDVLFGGAGNDTVSGGDGDDTLVGGDDDDVLSGGEGDDVLFGGDGDNILTGNVGADTFVWKLGDEGKTTLTDFNLSEGDKLNLSDLLTGLDGKTDADIVEIVTAGAQGDDVVIKFAAGPEIVLDGAADQLGTASSTVEILNLLQGTNSNP